MNLQNQLHFTGQSTAVLKAKQQLRRRKSFELPGGRALWLSGSKAACVVLMIVLGSSLWLNSVAKKLHGSIQNIEAQQYDIRDRQITLLAQRAQLMSENYVHQQARRELALVVPNSGQVHQIR